MISSGTNFPIMTVSEVQIWTQTHQIYRDRGYQIFGVNFFSFFFRNARAQKFENKRLNDKNEPLQYRLMKNYCAILKHLFQNVTQCKTFNYCKWIGWNNFCFSISREISQETVPILLDTKWNNVACLQSKWIAWHFLLHLNEVKSE